MKQEELKKLIKEAIREVIKEEFPRQMPNINEHQYYATPQYPYPYTPSPTAPYPPLSQDRLGRLGLDSLPQYGAPHPIQTTNQFIPNTSIPSTNNPLLDILAETAAQMTPEDMSNVRAGNEY